MSDQMSTTDTTSDADWTDRVTLTESAAERIRDMRRRVALIADRFGEDSPEHNAAARSLADVLTKVLTFGTGPSRVYSDGGLSLTLVKDSGFTLGIVFFRDRDAADRMLTRHGHDPADPANADMLSHFEDIAGTWSAHS